MPFRNLLVLMLFAGSMLLVGACDRESPPPPRFNEDLAESGEPALLPVTPVHFAGGVRGRLQRVDRNAGDAEGANGGEGAGESNPQTEAVRSAVMEFNTLVSNREYDGISEMFVSTQRDTLVDLWSVVKDASITINQALDQLTEALGVDDPSMLPEVDLVRAKAEAAMAGQLRVDKVMLEGDTARVMVGGKLFPGLTAEQAEMVTLRLADGEWQFDASGTLSDGDIEPLMDQIKAAANAAKQASSEYEQTTIDAKEYFNTIKSIVDSLAGASATDDGTYDEDASEADDADDDDDGDGDDPAAADNPPPTPASPPQRGPSGLQP